MVEPPSRRDQIVAQARRTGTVIGGLIGGIIIYAASMVTFQLLYRANGEQHAVGPAYDAGLILILGGPIALLLGAAIGRRIGWRIGQTRANNLGRTDPVPPRPD